MSLFEKYIFNYLFLLTEGRLEVVKNKYSTKVPGSVVDELASKDPSGNLKYLDWMVNQYNKQGNQIGKLIDAINLFHTNLNKLSKKDIFLYKNVEELLSVGEEANNQKSKSELKKQAKSDSDVLLDNDRYFVMSPKSHAASCYYGAGTKWCISRTKHSENMGAPDAQWNSYYNDRNIRFVFVLDKTKDISDPMYKYAFTLYPFPQDNHIDIFDAEDQQIYEGSVNFDHLRNRFPDEIIDLIEPYFSNVFNIKMEDNVETALTGQDERNIYTALQFIKNKTIPDEMFDKIINYSGNKHRIGYILSKLNQLSYEQLYKLIFLINELDIFPNTLLNHPALKSHDFIKMLVDIMENTTQYIYIDKDIIEKLPNEVLLSLMKFVGSDRIRMPDSNIFHKRFDDSDFEKAWEILPNEKKAIHWFILGDFNNVLKKLYKLYFNKEHHFTGLKASLISSLDKMIK